MPFIAMSNISGSYSNGALGLGSAEDINAKLSGGSYSQGARHRASNVPMPIEVQFDHQEEKRNMFCFAAAAGGCHTGALAIDLEVKLLVQYSSLL